MTKLVRDVEQIRFLRRKMAVRNFFVIGLMLLVAAGYFWWKFGPPSIWLPVVYVGVGSCLLTAAIVLTLTDWVHGGGPIKEE